MTDHHHQDTPLIRPQDKHSNTSSPLRPSGKPYPRAVVYRAVDDTWRIVIYIDPRNARILLQKTSTGTHPMSFNTRHAAMSHAAHEVHALRARRHPAGQPWLKDAS